MVEDIAGPAGRSQSPPVDLSDEQRRRAGAWWWPLSRRATLFSATSLLASGGIVGYALSQGKSSQNDFLLFTPVPPGERWSLAVDTAIEKASRFGSWLSTASQPLLYVLEKGFGGIELVAEHTIVFFYAHTFSWLVVIGGTWLATYMAKEAWKKYIWPEPKRKPAEEPIVRLEVNTEQSGADESSQGSVNVSVHVDRTRLLRRLPSLLTTATTQSSTEQEKPVDPILAAPKPIAGFVMVSFLAAPFHWLSTHLFFASVRLGWSSSNTLARVWLYHTGLVMSGIVLFELCCGGMKRIFTPDSTYKD